MIRYRNYRLIVFGVISLFILSCQWIGCGRSGRGVRMRSGSLKVSFEWKAENRCSDRSPRIVVDGIPSGTARLDVTMTDMDRKAFGHGGGSVKCKRTGRMVIPSGALQDYKGPCPSGSQHRYRIVVSCVSERGRITASGEAMRACCK